MPKKKETINGPVRSTSISKKLKKPSTAETALSASKLGKFPRSIDLRTYANIRAGSIKTPRISSASKQPRNVVPKQQLGSKLLRTSPTQSVKNSLQCDITGTEVLRPPNLVQFSAKLVEEAAKCETRVFITTNNTAIIKMITDVQRKKGHFGITFS